MTRRRKTLQSRQTPEARPPTAPRSRTVRFAIIFTVLVSLAGASELFLLRTHRGGAFQLIIANVPAVVSDTTIRIDAASIEMANNSPASKVFGFFV